MQAVAHKGNNSARTQAPCIPMDVGTCEAGAPAALSVQCVASCMHAVHCPRDESLTDISAVRQPDLLVPELNALGETATGHIVGERAFQPSHQQILPIG